MEAKQSIEGDGFGRIGSPSRRELRAPASSALKSVMFLWVGGFWAWVLVECLADHYPTFKALLSVLR